MIDRYTTKDVGRIWTDQNKYEVWKQVEIVVCEVLSDKGMIPKKSLNNIKSKADFNIKKIEEIENITHHDVIAFLTNLGEYIGPDSRFVHMGMTSSDLLDTSLGIQCKEAGNIIKKKLRKFSNVLLKKAVKYKDTFQIGRSHGVHAEPITFGYKMLLWYQEVERHVDRLDRAIESIAVGKISGAVGTFQHLDPDVEQKVCKKLKLKPAVVSNQVIQRDRHAEFLSVLALIGATIEKISIEIRHLQRTEVLEAEEFFSKGQKGSSAMPHKRNPIITERMTGFARLLRANAHTALENVALWHERDISHSSVERVIIPDSTILMDYMLDKMINLIDKLLVYPDQMIKNINKTNGLIFSQEVLLYLIKKGISREDAYRIVQRNAFRTWKEKIDFKKLILNDEDIKEIINKEEIEKLFNLKKILKNINKVYEDLVK